MTEPIGLAIIGAGMAVKPHVAALAELADTITVRGVYAPSQAKRDAFGAETGLPIAHTIDTLVEDRAVDAVLLLTPPNARVELVARFAGAGKHILTEKPLERTSSAAEAIVRACAHAGVTLGVVFQHRFRSASEALAERLASGALGTIRVVQAYIPWWRDQAYYDEPGRGTYGRDGGGVLMTQAIHTMDLMLSYTGPVAAVQAMCATTPFHTMEAEDVCAAAIMFENGALGSLFATTASYPGGAETLVFHCDHGTATLTAGTLTLDWRDGRSERIGETAPTGGGADPMAFPHDWHKSLLADFAEALQTGRPPRVTGADALHVHRLITALTVSSKEARRIHIAT